LQATPAVISTDPECLKQVLVNLVNNGLKFTASGSVTLRVAPDRTADDEAGIRFTVTDTGIGISEEQRTKLFQPFTQVDSSTTREHEGIGLGLAICDRLCRAMGSQIQLDSIPGKGSSFHFILPAPALSTPQEKHKAQDPQPGNDALVICADRLLRTLLQRLLEKQGWSVTTVESVENATHFVGTPKLVVFDLALAPGPSTEFAKNVIHAVPAAQYAAIDSDLSPRDQAATKDAGVRLLLPRNPTIASLSALRPEN
jgi:CheY-like chemotaxis protein